MDDLGKILVSGDRPFGKYRNQGIKNIGIPLTCFGQLQLTDKFWQTAIIFLIGWLVANLGKGSFLLG